MTRLFKSCICIRICMSLCIRVSVIACDCERDTHIHRQRKREKRTHILSKSDSLRLLSAIEAQAFVKRGALCLSERKGEREKEFIYVFIYVCKYLSFHRVVIPDLQKRKYSHHHLKIFSKEGLHLPALDPHNHLHLCHASLRPLSRQEQRWAGWAGEGRLTRAERAAWLCV